MIDEQYLKEFFMISSLKCSNCGSLGILIGKEFHCIQEENIPRDTKEKIITPKDFAIYNNQDWEVKFNTILREIVKYKKEAISIIPSLEKEWKYSCKAIKEIINK